MRGLKTVSLRNSALGFLFFYITTTEIRLMRVPSNQTRERKKYVIAWSSQRNAAARQQQGNELYASA